MSSPNRVSVKRVKEVAIPDPLDGPESKVSALELQGSYYGKGLAHCLRFESTTTQYLFEKFRRLASRYHGEDMKSDVEQAIAIMGRKKKRV